MSWLALLMILVGAYNAVARYLGRFLQANLSSNAYIELQWYMFSALFLLGAAYTLKEGGHVRVDVLYGRLGDRGKAWIDLVGTLLFLLPFCAAALWLSWPMVVESWRHLEGSPDSGGLPRYPVKTLMLFAWALLLLQGLSFAISRALFLASSRPSLPPSHENDQ